MNVYQAYDFLKGALHEAVEKSVPQTRPKPRKNVYITGEAMKLKRKKTALWNMYARTGDSVDYAQYCSCRNKLRSLTRRLRKEFEQHISRELKSMGVATTTDTTDSVRTSFEVFKNLYGMSVQVDETAKNKKESTAAS